MWWLIMLVLIWWIGITNAKWWWVVIAKGCPWCYASLKGMCYVVHPWWVTNQRRLFEVAWEECSFKLRCWVVFKVWLWPILLECLVWAMDAAPPLPSSACLSQQPILRLMASSHHHSSVNDPLSLGVLAAHECKTWYTTTASVKATIIRVSHWTQLTQATLLHICLSLRSQLSSPSWFQAYHHCGEATHENLWCLASPTQRDK